MWTTPQTVDQAIAPLAKIVKNLKSVITVGEGRLKETVTQIDKLNAVLRSIGAESERASRAVDKLEGLFV